VAVVRPETGCVGTKLSVMQGLMHFVMSHCAVVAVKMHSGKLDLFLEVYCLLHTDYYDVFVTTLTSIL